MFYFAPSSPRENTGCLLGHQQQTPPLSFQMSKFQSCAADLPLNREFILCTFHLPASLEEEFLLLSREDSWQIQCNGTTSPHPAGEAKRSQPCCNLSPRQFDPPIYFLLSLKIWAQSVTSYGSQPSRSPRGCWGALCRDLCWFQTQKVQVAARTLSLGSTFSAVGLSHPWRSNFAFLPWKEIEKGK